jgi:hypothetical protein
VGLAKSPAFQARPIVARRREIPRHACLAVDPAPREARDERSADLVHAAVSTQLSDESSARLERRRDASDDIVSLLHPVEHRVAEDGVELALELETLTAANPRVQPEMLRGGDLFRARIDPDDVAA